MMNLDRKVQAMLMSSAPEVHEVKNEFLCVASGVASKQ